VGKNHKMNIRFVSRSAPHFPASLVEFQHQFPDDDACAAWLVTRVSMSRVRRRQGWPHGGKPFASECAACSKQTSVTAGTIMHGSKLPLIVGSGLSISWPRICNGDFGAAIAKAAWARLLQVGLAAVRQAAPRHGRAGPRPLAGLIEVDEAKIPLRTKADPVCSGGGRSPQGKMFVAGAVEVESDAPGRLRLAAKDFSAASPMSFCPGSTAPSPTPIPGRSASITDCGDSISRATSTNSSSASTQGQASGVER